METRGIAVCDDEKFVHEEAERLFSNYQKKGKFSYKLYHCFSAEALLIISKQVEIILLDIDMPQIDGIEAAQKLAKKGEDKCIIMLTSKRDRFKDAIKFEGYAIEFSIGWGHLGSNPLEIYRYLNKRGFKYSKYTSYKDFKYAIDHKKSCKAIMSRWNDGYKSLHTFYVKKEDYGKHYGYNWSYGSTTVNRSSARKSLNSFNDGAGFIVGYLGWK